MERRSSATFVNLKALLVGRVRHIGAARSHAHDLRDHFFVLGAVVVNLSRGMHGTAPGGDRRRDVQIEFFSSAYQVPLIHKELDVG